MRLTDERPVTRVRISQGYYLGKTEVTQAEWQAVMGNNPSHFSGCGRCPVEEVSWEDVQVVHREAQRQVRRGSATGCRPRRSGSMRPGRGPPPTPTRGI